MAFQPGDAKWVRKSFFARHSIPVAYLRRDDSRPIHSSKITIETLPSIARDARDNFGMVSK
jgi:hypothetical protein